MKIRNSMNIGHQFHGVVQLLDDSLSCNGGSPVAELSLGHAQETSIPIDKEVLSCDVEMNEAYRVLIQ